MTALGRRRDLCRHVWSGFAYVALVTDVFSRRIVGWNVAATLKADILPLRALDTAAWAAGGNLGGWSITPITG